MLTQQDILNRLNQLTLHYNLTWRDVMYDADKAITKINNYMGTVYPLMSDQLLSPTDTYTFRSLDKEIPFFDDRYIHSIVIPFIAMEVLARDEEFTTIYNKYAIEVEDGLFHMFSNEFNRVPISFRQTPDQGVFFASDGALEPIARTLEDNAPNFKFKVYYHINNDEIVIPAGISFVDDGSAYDYNTEVIIRGWNSTLLNMDGNKAFVFTGWTEDIKAVGGATVEAGDTLTIVNDIHLYAVWTQDSTLKITYDGVVYIKPDYISLITTLVVPDLLNGVIVRHIPSNFLLSGATLNSAGEVIETYTFTETSDNIRSIVLPNYLVSLETQAFNGFNGTNIVFAETPLGIGYRDGLTIKANAFQSAPNLESVILPSNIVTISGTAFPEQNHQILYIYVRYLKDNVPAWDGVDQTGWYTQWYAPTNETNAWTVVVEYGYNG